MVQKKIRRYLKHGTLPQLSVFDAVARLGSFTKAAEELYMAQPTVSVQMKKLAETVGLPLIEQIGKNIHLTEAGRVLHAASAHLIICAA
jgi:LysR family transcriptional regulator, low CO2-responsive transcriptional regulator